MSSQDQLPPRYSIVDLVALLKDRVCAAIEAGDEFEALLSHEELISAALQIHLKERLEARRRKRNGAQDEQLL